MPPPVPRASLRVILAAVSVAAVAVGGLGTAAQADPGDLRSPVDKAPRATLDTAEIKVPEPAAAKDKLGQHDRQLLEDARADGTKRVTLIMATDKGQTSSVASSVTKEGGWTATTNDRIGYVRASVPTSKVEKVVGLSKVVAVDLDESIPLPDPSPEAERTSAKAVKGPGATTKNDNAYMPTRETGSIDFKKVHRTWDGRGVTIGILDSGVDLDHPSLATTSTGERKIVDWVTATDPVFDGDATWRAMLTEVSGESFSYAGSTWTAPKDGEYTINRFSESITEGSEPDGDVNRDGDTTDRFGVLYDNETNDTWVDSNQDFTFSNDELMRPYKEKFDVGHFGTDDPATDIVEQMPFVVEYREDVSLAPYGLPGTADFVNIGIVEDAHGSHVAGITAANSMFGGNMDGQAPGAKLVSSRACTWGGGCTAAALADGMVDLVANRGVDVVNMSIGGLPALNDGNNARARLYDRIISEYGVQLFISAGNSGAGVNTIGDPSVATDVVSVASSISKETWLANYGSVVSSKLALHNFSSRGPREDGGFKPNIMAPGSAVSTVPQWLEQPGVAEVGYTLPVGYAMFNGTSMASPQAAGSAALLLSAGFATGTPITPRQMREAMYTSADYQKKLEAVSQGTGQVDVPGAWKILRKNPRTQDYTASAPVCTALSAYLATPNQGTGVYNDCASTDGGQKVKETTSYAVSLTRTSGSTKAVRHTVKIIGNDGTFRAPKTISLRSGVAKDLRVVARARTEGLHSAILEIDDPSTPVVDHRVMLAVVASSDLVAPRFATTTTGSVERNLYKRIFVTVPEGAKALQVNLKGIATRSQVRWVAFSPYGVPVDSTASSQCYTNYSDQAACKPTSRSYSDPLPGVWELIVEARRTSPFLSNPFRVTAAVQGVTVDPEIQTVSATPGDSVPVSWEVTNDFGEVSLAPKGGPLGSAVSERRSIDDGEVQEFEVVVPEGASRLDAVIGNTSDLGSDLDLTVLDESGKQVAQSADGDSEEGVSIPNPAPGTYTVVVDAYDVPSGTTEYDYRDVFFSPELGSLSVPSNTTSLGAGASVTFTGSLASQDSASDGRQLFGEMQVLSSEGALLGTGSVLVGP